MGLRWEPAFDRKFNLVFVLTVFIFQTYDGFSSEITCLSFSKDERYLFIGSGAGSVIVWDVQQNRVVLTFKEHLSKCTCIFAQDCSASANHLLASGSVDTKVKLWDLRSKSSIHTLKNHTKPVTGVRISDSTGSDFYVASCSSDSYVKISNWRTGRNIATLRNGSAGVCTIAINSKNKTLVSGHSDRQLKHWDLEKSKILNTTPGESNICQKLMFHEQENNDNTNMVVAAYPEAVKIYDIQRSSAMEIIMKP